MEDDNNTACKILMTKTELRKSLDFVNEERDRLQRELEDYKSRIEKAVDYMKKHIEKCNIAGYEGKFDNFDIFTKPQELLNILKGEDNE